MSCCRSSRHRPIDLDPCSNGPCRATCCLPRYPKYWWRHPCSACRCFAPRRSGPSCRWRARVGVLPLQSERLMSDRLPRRRHRIPALRDMPSRWRQRVLTDSNSISLPSSCHVKPHLQKSADTRLSLSPTWTRLCPSVIGEVLHATRCCTHPLNRCSEVRLAIERPAPVTERASCNDEAFVAREPPSVLTRISRHPGDLIAWHSQRTNHAAFLQTAWSSTSAGAWQLVVQQRPTFRVQTQSCRPFERQMESLAQQRVGAISRRT